MMNLFANKPYSNLTPQCKTILDHCAVHGSISGMEAIGMHRIMSLGKRISELVNDHGYTFTKERKTEVTGKRYMRYSLELDHDPIGEAV